MTDGDRFSKFKNSDLHKKKSEFAEHSLCSATCQSFRGKRITAKCGWIESSLDPCCQLKCLKQPLWTAADSFLQNSPVLWPFAQTIFRDRSRRGRFAIRTVRFWPLSSFTLVDQPCLLILFACRTFQEFIQSAFLTTVCHYCSTIMVQMINEHFS